MYCYCHCPQPCSRPLLTMSLLETPRHSWASLGHSLCGVTAPVSWVRVHISFYLCPPRVYFPVLCKFWQIYGGVNGYLFQEGLCHTHVCFTQSPCPCGSPLLTCTSTGDTQTQLCLSLCGVTGSWCARGLFEPSGSCAVLEQPLGDTPHPRSGAVAGFTGMATRRYLPC